MYFSTYFKFLVVFDILFCFFLESAGILKVLKIYSSSSSSVSTLIIYCGLTSQGEHLRLNVLLHVKQKKVNAIFFQFGKVQIIVYIVSFIT